MGRSAATNPFTPGFGNLPRVFAGRKSEFGDLELLVDRLAQGIYEQVRLVTGDRGVGKTTLLREFEEEQREAGRWVVRASATRGDAVVGRLCRSLANLLHEHDLAGSLARGGRDALRRLAGLSIGPAGVSVDLAAATDGDRADELEHLLAAVGHLARDRGTVLLLLVDEAQNIGLDALGDLFHALQEVQGRVVTSRAPTSGALRRDALPIGAVVAGLPGLVSRLKAAGSTFGERSKPLPLYGFGEADMREGIRALAREGGAVFDADAVERLMEACGGYPYFLHLIGAQMWNAGDSDVVTAQDADSGLTSARPLVADFYDQRLRDLGPLQRRYLAAAARLDERERSPGAVAATLDRRSQQLGSTQQALIAQHGLLRSSGDGRLQFALPGLAEHLRAQPEPD